MIQASRGRRFITAQPRSSESRRMLRRVGLALGVGAVTASVVFGAAGCSVLPGGAPKAANASTAVFTDAQVQQAFTSLETMLSDPFIYNGNIASDLTPVPDFTASAVSEQCIPVPGAVTLAVAADARKDIRITSVSTGRYDGQVSVSYRTAARTLASTDDATSAQQALNDAAGDATCTTVAASAMKQNSLAFECQEAFCDIKASSGEGSAAQYAVIRRFAYGNLLINVAAGVYGDGSSLDQINLDDLTQMVAKIQSALDDAVH